MDTAGSHSPESNSPRGRVSPAHGPFPQVVAGVGFEPTEAKPTVLQTAPFGHSGNLPCAVAWTAQRRIADTRGSRPISILAWPAARAGPAGPPPPPPADGARRAGGARSPKSYPYAPPTGREPCMADSSFDIVSKIERQEVDNALNQTAKEVSPRFDFRGGGP